MAQMDIRQIEAFVAVVSTGGMTSAAKMLDVSQPSITRLIQELEKTLGFELIHRNGPKISITPKGMKFLQEAENLLAATERAIARADSIRQDKVPFIKIATISAVGNSIMPKTLGRIGNDVLPDALRISVSSAEDVEQAVLSRQADIGFSNPPFDHPGLDLLGLYSVPCVLAVSLDHPLAHRKSVSIKELTGQTLINMATQFRFRRLVLDALTANGISAEREIICSSMVTAIQLVRENLGIAIVESLTAHLGPAKEVAMIPLEEEIRFYWGAICSSGINMDPSLVHIVDLHEEIAVQSIPGFIKHS